MPITQTWAVGLILIQLTAGIDGASHWLARFATQSAIFRLRQGHHYSKNKPTSTCKAGNHGNETSGFRKTTTTPVSISPLVPIKAGRQRAHPLVSDRVAPF
ncbi:hypothetical protein ACLOJK_039796 [Asimina triloba]